MELKTFFMAMTIEERDAFAKRCGTSRQHITNISYGRTCGEALAINIERESKGSVRCDDLRPDVDWAYLRGTDVDWAYLRGTDCPPKEAA